MLNPVSKISTKICILARAVIVDAAHILLCKTKGQPKNFYFLPGGHVEAGENVQSALIRELNEEIGYNTFTIGRYLGCIEHFHLANIQSLCHNHEYNFIFLAYHSEFNFTNTLNQPEQGQDLEWVALNQLSSIAITPTNLNSLILSWLDNIDTTKNLITHYDPSLVQP